MALRDQPYLPLYIQDVLTDEKLIECSPEAHGVYFRLLCILHKQEQYGCFCLKQKYKQNKEQILDFASAICKQMPFAEQTVQNALAELLAEDVIQIEGDMLYQKRMKKDGELSLMRAEIGKLGGSSVTKQYGKPGFIYWISDYYDKQKIGISVNPQNRLYRLRSDLKIKSLNIVKTINVKDMGLAEDEALSFFDKERDGEWIKLKFEPMKKKFALLEAKLKQKYSANS